MAIYDPITRQTVTIKHRWPKQQHCFRFGKKVKGDFQFVRVVYGDNLPGFNGGFDNGTERDIDVNSLVADDGTLEISKAVKAAPAIEVVEA